MKKKCVLGIDPSIRSTGLCIWRTNELGESTNDYFLITSKITKKMASIDDPHICIQSYTSKDVKNLTSIGKEQSKTYNVKMISAYINNILMSFHPDYIVMEAIAYAANGTIDQLAGLNYVIRMSAMTLNIPIYIIPPTTIKMESVGNGQATKEIMIDTWQKLETKLNKDIFNIKCDDLADAYFMAHFPKDKIKIEQDIKK